MILYKFYSFDKQKGEVLIGILPERRTNPQRISQESIMNWIRKMPFSVNPSDVYFESEEVKGLDPAVA